MPKSKSSTVCGERRRAITCASRSNRRMRLARGTGVTVAGRPTGRISLMAAGRASIRCRARQTSPIPPSPSFSSRLIAPQLARALDLGAQAVDHAGADIGHAHHEQIGKHQPEEELQRVQPERGARRRRIVSPMMTGTELTDARAASSARRGRVGTTTVNSTTHTATQDRPKYP